MNEVSRMFSIELFKSTLTIFFKIRIFRYYIPRSRHVQSILQYLPLVEIPKIDNKTPKV